MVNAATAIDTGSTSVARFAQTPSAVVLSSAAGNTDAQPESGAITNLAEKLRYNAFEFSYRQDFGKIVLLRQEPETGELVQQFPSEYYLQKYAQSERIARQSLDEAGANAPAPAANADVAPVNQANAVSQPVVAAAPVGDGAPSAAPSAPVITSAPSLPGGSVGAGVDITV